MVDWLLLTAALGRRWQRFDVEYQLPADLPASVKSRDGKLVYVACASVTVVRPLSRLAAAAWSTSVECWSPEVRFVVEGTHAHTFTRSFIHSLNTPTGSSIQ